MLKVDLEVPVFPEPVGDCLSAQSRAEVLVEGVADFRHKHLIPLVGEGHEDREEAHVDAMVDMHIADMEGDGGVVQLHDGLSEGRKAGGGNVAVVALLPCAFPHQFVAYFTGGVPLSGIWNCFCP